MDSNSIPARNVILLCTKAPHSGNFKSNQAGASIKNFHLTLAPQSSILLKTFSFQKFKYIPINEIVAISS